MEHDGSAGIERFRPTSGRVSGWLTIAIAAVVAVLGLAYLDVGFPLPVVTAAVLVGVLAWAAMVRPALWVRDREVLVLRNMLETVEVRLAAVEEMALRQVLVLRAADRRWVSTVVGRSWQRSLTSGRRKGRSGGDASGAARAVAYPDFVEERLRHLVEEARERAGVRPGSPEQLALPDAVRLERAWLPIGLIALAAVLFLVTLFL
jgi:hypothetical protein